MDKSNRGEFRNDRKPLVSIIIPAYNEEKVIGTLIASLGKQTFRDIETIVVDDASKDRTVEIARKYTQKVYLRRHAERSRQRNFGAEKASGMFLLFLDADMSLSLDVVNQCVKAFSLVEKVGAVVIPEKSVAENFWERVKAFERSFYNLEGDETTDAARFFSKRIFDKAGGYDETITGPEDWDLPETIRKMGYKIGRVKSVIYHHERIPSLLSIMKKKYYYALKAHRYFSKQKVSLIGPKTVYFLRPVFYRNWRKIISHPLLSLAMLIMFFAEMLAGGTGVIVGKIKNS